MKRILHLIKGLGWGGAEQLLLNAATYLDRSRFEYEVGYLLPNYNALVQQLEEGGLKIHCLNGSRGIGWVQRLRQLVRERDIDVVHDHSPYVAIGTRLSLTGPSRPRLVYTEHNVWEAYHRATYWGNLLTYPRSDHVFAVSEHVRASIRYPGPLRSRPMPRIETLYHGVDPASVRAWADSDGVREELEIPVDAPLVGTVANFRRQKGHGILLHAAVHVRRAFPDVRFVLVGHGPLESRTRRLCRELDLDRSVVFTGARHDAPRLAAAFDVFALPSLHEGLGIAVIEAMTLGRPVVVTRVGGLKELVEDGMQGLLVEPGNAEAFADAIIRLLRDTTLRQRLGEQARLFAARFDIRNAVRRHEEVYTELLTP